jgi:predicted DNA-binding protein YlxM (UPF0122 family)
MKPKNSGLERIGKGKKFHKKIQKDWRKNPERGVDIEKAMTKPGGRKGRMDVFVKSDESLVAIAEIKGSDWDAMKRTAVHKNVMRQANQIWDYIESQLELGKDVSPGVIFPKRPKKPDRMSSIEELFNERGIQVVWEDESIEERKARS